MNSELIERIGIILRIYMGFVEEYFYHDKLVWDSKVVYVRDTTEISMALNSLAKKTGGKIRYRVDIYLN